MFVVDVFRESFSQLRSDEKTILITRLVQSKSTPSYETRRSKKIFYQYLRTEQELNLNLWKMH